MSKLNKNELTDQELERAAGGFSPPLSSYDQLSDEQSLGGQHQILGITEPPVLVEAPPSLDNKGVSRGSTTSPTF